MGRASIFGEDEEEGWQQVQKDHGICPEEQAEAIWFVTLSCCGLVVGRRVRGGAYS